MFYSKQELKSSLFLDIESYPNTKISDNLKELWKEKFHFKYLEKEIEFQKKLIAIDSNSYISNIEVMEREINEQDIFIKYAPLHPEFSEVFCVSVGVFSDSMEKEVVCIAEESEKETLEKFNKFLKNSEYILAGYNIKTFDIPFLIKRFLINKIKLPPVLQLRGKKPWEIRMLDVCEDWKGLSRESSSLDLVCNVLGVDSPKDEFKNYEIWTKFFNKEITKEKIHLYCNKDVAATMDTALMLTN